MQYSLKYFVLILTYFFCATIIFAEPSTKKHSNNQQQSLYIGTDEIPEPVRIVESQTNILLQELSNRKTEFDQDPQKLIAFAKNVALSHWDFTRVSRIILGPYWKHTTINNQQLFIKEFLRTILRYVVKAYGY